MLRPYSEWEDLFVASHANAAAHARAHALAESRRITVPGAGRGGTLGVGGLDAGVAEVGAGASPAAGKLRSSATVVPFDESEELELERGYRAGGAGSGAGASSARGAGASGAAPSHGASAARLRLEAALARKPPLPDSFSVYAVAGGAHTGLRGALHHALRPFGLHSGAALRRTLDQLVVFVANPLNIVDLMAIMPLTSTGGTITILRVLRLARVARLAHLSNRLVMARLLMRTLSRSGEALSLLVLLIFILCSFFGTVLFYVESGDYDPVRRTWLRPTLLGTGLEESPFRSIPVAMWWAVSTISTVGCMYPRLGETPPPAHRPPQRSHLFHHRAPSASSACPPSC